MTLFINLVDSPLIWAIVGLAIGIILGVNNLSMWLITAGLAMFPVYLILHGKAEGKTEGRLFSAGGIFMMSWVIGFIVHGQIS